MSGGRKAIIGACLLIGCSSSGGSPGSGGASGSGGSATSSSSGAGGSGGSVAAGGSAGATTPPLVSDPNGNFPSRLQLSAGYLYWLSGTHQLVRAAVDGTQVKTLFTHAGSDESIIAIGDFAVDAQSIYFTDEGDGAATDRGVYALPLDGSSAPVKLVSGSQPAHLALDGDTLCFVDGSDLRQVKTSGDSALVLLHGGLDYRTTLIVSQGFVYFPTAFGADAQDLYRLPLGVPDPEAAPSAGGTGGGIGAGGAAAGGASAGASGAGGGTHNGAQKISAVPGRYEILLASRADHDNIYWGVEETIYEWTGSSGGASSVAVVTDPLNEQDTSPPHDVLVPFDGTLFWVGGESYIYQQQLPSGMRTVVAPVATNSIALDSSYVYAPVSRGIARYTR